MTEYVIDQRFQSRVERSPRVLECAEAFGLGLNDTEFIVYDNVSLDVQKGDVVYITGQSGSGKSLLLRELHRQMSEKEPVADIESVELKDLPLIEQIGDTTTQAIEILSMAGLNDAYLFIRKPSELSDGQLYRFKVAKLAAGNCRVWVADEFGAVLDRTTAKLVAFNLQKFARRCGATLIVATTHKDLMDELGPNLYIDKRFKEKLLIENFNREKAA